MADITFGRFRPTQQLAIDDHGRSDAGSDLDEEHEMRRRIDPALLAQAKHVGVVVDDRRHLVMTGQVITNWIVVPARHADRPGDPASLPVHRTRYAEGDSAQ